MFLFITLHEDSVGANVCGRDINYEHEQTTTTYMLQNEDD